MPDVVRAISDMYQEAMILVDALQKPRAREKLMYTLSFIASRFMETTSTEKRNNITVPLTQQDLADLSGMTRRHFQSMYRYLRSCCSISLTLI